MHSARCMQEDEQRKSYLRRWAWVEELTVVLVVVLLVVADRRLALPLLYCFCVISPLLSLSCLLSPILPPVFSSGSLLPSPFFSSFLFVFGFLFFVFGLFLPLFPLSCWFSLLSSPLSPVFFLFLFPPGLSLFIGKNGAGAPSITQRLVGQWPVRWSKGVGLRWGRGERGGTIFENGFCLLLLFNGGKEEDEQCRSKRHRSGLPLFFFIYMKRRRFG